jgi:uncharacterized tellurite resistance protein B-like protein
LEPNPSILLSLAKVMVAAAWADGNINTDEINCLKDVLFHMKGMTAADWAQIEIYIDSPVSEAERQRLVEELQSQLKSTADREQAIAALDQMVSIDGIINESERAALDQIKASIQGTQTGSIKRWNLFARKRVESRAEAVQSRPNREAHMDDYIKNKIYYDVSSRLEQENIPTEIPESELRRLSLAGGLMARVAYVDEQVSEAENQVIIDAIQKYWGKSQVEATVIAECAAAEISRDIDYYRLTREFFEVTEEDERVRFLDALFAVAAGDGQASFAEIEEIRKISNGLLLSHKQFIEAKLTLPAEKRID